MLLNHIFRLIHRAGKHELPNKCGTLSLECVQVYRFGGVNDSANTALRLNGFAHGLPMLVGTRGIEDIIDHVPLYLLELAMCEAIKAQAVQQKTVYKEKLVPRI